MEPFTGPTKVLPVPKLLHYFRQAVLVYELTAHIKPDL